MTDDAMAYRRNQTLRRCPFGDRRRPQADPTLPSPDEQESGTVGVGGLLGVLAVAVLVSAGPVRAEGSEDEQAPSPQIVEVVPGPSRMESSVTSSAVTLVDSDEGKAAKVRVSSSADDGNDKTLTGAATRAPTTTLSDDATLSDLTLTGADRILRVTGSRAPAFMTDTQVREAEENNSPLGIVAKVLALDPKGATLTYTLSGPDAASERFYTPAIAWLTDFKVVPGCEPQLFCPHRPATRAAGALFISGVAIRLHIWGPGNTALIFNKAQTA